MFYEKKYTKVYSYEKVYSTQWCVELILKKKFMDIVFEKFNWIVIERGLKVVGLQIVLWRLIFDFLIVNWIPVCLLFGFLFVNWIPDC